LRREHGFVLDSVHRGEPGAGGTLPSEEVKSPRIALAGRAGGRS
jgi:hypothetical protein